MLAGVLVVAFNLRTSITVVGPLVPLIRADTQASNVLLGLVGTIPVLAFGLIAPAAPVLGRRFGVGRTLAGSLVLLSAAIALRSAGGIGWLLVGTALLGIAIAIGNVLLPSLVKGRFPSRATTLTSAYTAVMILAATLSAGVAVPLAEPTSWELSAGIWAVPAAIGALVVAASVLAHGRLVAEPDTAGSPAQGLQISALYRSPLAWQVTAFMGLQSTLFFVANAWLPDILVDKGMDVVRAGAMISVLNIAGLVGVLAVPQLSRGRRDQLRAAVVAVGCNVVGSTLLLAPGTAIAPVATGILGVGLGATVGLALSFFALRTTTADDAASLSGMAQMWGYLVAAAGPVVWGALRDATGSWTLPLVLLVVIAVTSAVFGLLSARDRVLSA